MIRVDTIVLAHAGFGPRYELPIPLWLFALAGGLVVLASFALVVRRAHPEGDELSAVDVVPPCPVRPVRAAVGILLTLLVALVGLTGTQELAGNLAPLTFWVIAWILVPLSCAVFGDWTRPWNPFANLARLADRESLRQTILARKTPLEWSPRLGWWPAVALFALLVLGELVFNTNATQPAFVGAMLLLYAVMSVFLGLLFGPAWLARGEVFSGLFDAWGRLGFWRHGAPGRRGFAGGLDVPFDGSPSRVVFVLLLLVSINFDGLLATPQWASYERRTFGADTSAVEQLRTLSLVGLVLVVLALFVGFAYLSARMGKLDRKPMAALAELLPSLVPIAFGYLVAHNLGYLVTNLQTVPALLGNPGYANWPIHLPAPFNSTASINRTALPNAFYWYFSVGVIVAVHVVAVLLANRRLTAHAATRSAGRRAEYVWLLAMIAYTAFSLYLIAQPITEAAA